MENERYQTNMKSSLLPQILVNVKSKKKLKKFELIKNNLKNYPLEKERNYSKVSLLSKIKTFRTNNQLDKLKEDKRKIFSILHSDSYFKCNKTKKFYPFALSTFKNTDSYNQQVIQQKQTIHRSNSCHFKYSEESSNFFRKEKQNFEHKEHEKNGNNCHHQCNIYWVSFNNRRYQKQSKAQAIITSAPKKEEINKETQKDKKILIKKSRKHSDQLSTKVSFCTISLKSSQQNDDLLSLPLRPKKKFKTKSNLSLAKFTTTRDSELFINDTEYTPYAKVSIVFSRFPRNRSMPLTNRSSRSFYPFHSKDLVTQN